MKRTVLGVGLVVWFASAAGAQDAQVAKGKELYTTLKCQMCHAIEGKGNKMFPLDGVGSKLSADDIRKWLVNPKEMEAKLATKPKMAMKSFESRPKEEIDALVAYMVSLKK
jgi:cytochrome c2